MELFKGIEKDETNADIGWIVSKASTYEYGYLKAAQILSKGYSEHYVIDKDSLIFPIIFLYRQHIELSIKSIIRKLDKRLVNERKDNILEKHRLLDLWDEMIKLYTLYISQNNLLQVFISPPLNKEREIVKEFHKVDQDSFSFRYSTSKDGNELLKDITYISLDHFQTQISTVVDAIDKISETLAHSEH